MGLVLVEAGERRPSPLSSPIHLHPTAFRGLTRAARGRVQVQNCFDDPKRTWEGPKGELEARLKALGGAGLFGGGGYSGMYGGGPAQQYAQLEQVSLHFGL